MNWIKRLFNFFSFQFVSASSAKTEGQEVMKLIEDYLRAKGGVAQVIKDFEGKGFMGKVRSWVSNGPNQPINSIEALQLFGWKDLRAMADKSGIPVDQLRDELAEFLPIAIDRATAAGTVPAR